MTAPYALALDPTEAERYRWMAGEARRAEAGAWDAAGVLPGATVADLGCGPGAVLVELAARVGPAGRVEGIDRDPGAAEAARAAVAGLDNVRVTVADVAATGLPAGGFDVVMLRHVLAHLGKAAPAALDHAARLLRPGGHVVAVDTDLDASRRVPGDPDLEDELRRYVSFLSGRGGDAQAGPFLARALEASGLEVVQFGGRYDVLRAEATPTLGPARAARAALLASGQATPEDARRWDEAGARWLADPRGRYVLVPVFVAVARKPS